MIIEKISTISNMVDHSNMVELIHILYMVEVGLGEVPYDYI